jgi:subfamily B ATP-binding cassette protein MsbA
MNLQSLRGLMGLVTQDSILFNDTIKANISLGKPDANGRNYRGFKIANAYEFVNELKGIHTNIGDSGNKLSGGQNKGFRSLVLF